MKEVKVFKNILSFKANLSIVILIVIVTLIVGCIPKPSETPPEGNQEGVSPFHLATRITSRVTEKQIEFVNKHFEFVMTPVLSSEMREKVKGPVLFLYRSIQGTWTDFDHFDWSHIDANENMFCHNSSPDNPYPNNRIKTIWNSWLMDGGDLVDKDDPDALNHWVNYYAVTASKQVHEFDYDGLFIDSAGHKLSKGAVRGLMPDDYSDEKWRDDRYKALKFIKSYLPDKIVVFNGLHSGNGAEKSLEFTDGGMWETFIFNPNTGNYFGEKKWEEVINLVERNKDGKKISLVVKKKGITENLKDRLFAMTSYLLVSSENVSFTLVDLNYDKLNSIFYYPEYELNLGLPVGEFEDQRGIYKREFENAVIFVNPGKSKSYTIALDEVYKKVIPSGGGPVSEDGTYSGKIRYETVSGEIKLPPKSGIILLKQND